MSLRDPSVSGDSDLGQYARLDGLAAEFAARYRRGERPDLEDYARRHPELAEAIRDLFPAMVGLEKAEAIRGESDGGVPGGPAPAPSRVGDFRILRQVGRGGMGVVYEAVQVSLGRHVALKVLPSGPLRDPKALERFRREARAAARLHHTNIVPVFEVGQDGDVLYYTMQFIQGQGLDVVIEELKRLRRAGQAAGPAPGPSGGHRESDRTMDSSGRHREGPATRIARSLLTGGVGIVSTDRPEPAGLTADGVGGGPILDPTAPDCAEAPDTPVDDGARPSGSAVMPGGAPISSFETSAGRQTYHRSVAQIGRQAAEALAYAHARGVVHRDIKPSNLLLDTSGVVWITDFGLAKAEEGDLTATGDLLGTLRYMAPERLQGEGDARADVYALGLTLYELLMLRPAFDASDRLRLMEQIRDQDPARLRAVDPRIARDLETLVLKAIDKDPTARYQAAAEMAEDLRRFLDGEPIRARTVGELERAWKWAMRRKALAVACVLGLLAVLLGGLGGAAAWHWRAAETARYLETLARASAVTARAEAERQRDKANVARNQADTARVAEQGVRAEAERQREKFERFEYGRTIQVAHQEWRENGVPATLALLESTRADLRGWEWRYVHRLCHSELVTLKGHTSMVGSASFSPDGSRVVTASADKTAKVWDTKTGAEVLTLKGHTDFVESASFSPDGLRVVTASRDATAKVWDAKSGAEVLTLKGHTDFVESASFSPDGSRVVTGSADTTAKVWDAKTGAHVLTVKGHARGVTSASFSPDGSRIVTGGFDKTAKVWDAQTGAEVLTLKGHTGYVYSASFSPDGLRVVTASRDATANVWDARTGAAILTLRGHTRPVFSASFSPDGSRIVTGSIDKTAKVWDAQTGAEILPLKGHIGFVHSASFSPDGLQVVTGGLSHDDTAKVWDARTGTEVLTLKGHIGSVESASFSPDGSRVVTAGWPPIVWDANSGAEVLTLKGNTNFVNWASFSPDGSRVVTANRDATANIWDARTGAAVLTLKGHRGGVRSASFSPDGSWVVTGSVDTMAKVWDARSGAEILTLKGHTSWVESASFSPDGSRVVTASADKTARIWDAKSGAAILTLKGHRGGVHSASFSPDGSWVVTGSVDTMAKVWDARSGAEILTLKGHTGDVYSASFSPDGSRIVTGSLDDTAKVWDTQSGAAVLTLKGHTDDVRSATFSPDGSRIVTGGFDGTAKVWDARPFKR
jgi:WD40 repeat protein/serine/threonine protein kinase